MKLPARATAVISVSLDGIFMHFNSIIINYNSIINIHLIKRGMYIPLFNMNIFFVETFGKCVVRASRSRYAVCNERDVRVSRHL